MDCRAYRPAPYDASSVVAALEVREALGARPRGPRAAAGRGGSGARPRRAGESDGTSTRRRTGGDAAARVANVRAASGGMAHGTSMVRRPRQRPRAALDRLARDCHAAWSGLDTRLSAPARPSAAPRLVERRPHRRRQPPAHAPARAAEGEVGDGGEALLVLAQREQQVRDAVAGRQRRASARCTHQQCTRRPPGATSSAPASPTSQTPSAPRSSTSPVRACSSRASWPTRSPSSPSAVALRRRRRPRGCGLTTFAPRLA